MVQRHVREGEATLERQRLLIRRLAALSLPTEEAVALLVLLEQIQDDHLAHLARLYGAV